MSYKKFKKNPKKLQQYASKLIPGVSQLFGKDQICTYPEALGRHTTLKLKE